MNFTHAHIIVNHVPTIGFAIAVALFAIALFYQEDRLQRLSLMLMFVIALVTIPVYLTGVAAAGVLQERFEVSAALISSHEDAALSAFALMQLTGGFAWLGLWQARRFSRPLRGTLIAVGVLSIASFALMGYAASIGGAIRHPEILNEAQAAAAETVPAVAWLRTAPIIALINDTPWAWPAGEAVHFIGLALSFGVVLVINLRVLGMMRAIAVADLHRLLPWGIAGFAMNLVTGMMFFIATPEQYVTNTPFIWKMIFLMLVGTHLIYFTSNDAPWRVGAQQQASLPTRSIAAVAIFLWLGVIYLGRMLPYLGNAY